MTRVTPAQTAEILELLAQGKERFEIAEKVGVRPGQVIAVKAVAARVRDRADIEGDEAIDDAIEMTFALERDLQQALRKNIDQLEAGLTIIDDGKEQTVPSGRIDITARDANGAIVVIELRLCRRTEMLWAKSWPTWAI